MLKDKALKTSKHEPNAAESCLSTKSKGSCSSGLTKLTAPSQTSLAPQSVLPLDYVDTLLPPAPEANFMCRTYNGKLKPQAKKRIPTEKCTHAARALVAPANRGLSAVDMAFASCTETCNTIIPLTDAWTNSCGLGVTHPWLTQEQEQIGPSYAIRSRIIGDLRASTRRGSHHSIGHRAAKQAELNKLCI